MSFTLCLSPPPMCCALASLSRCLCVSARPMSDDLTTLLCLCRSGGLHGLCAAGFVTREACSPHDLLSVWRRCRQAPDPVYALRRLEKRRGERPPLQHGSSGEPGYITSRAHQHTTEPCGQSRPRGLVTVRFYRPGTAVLSTAPSGSTPVLTNRQSAISNLRARATIPSWRSRVLPAPKRRSYHWDNALAGWKRRHAHAMAIAIARIGRWPALAIPRARCDCPL